MPRYTLSATSFARPEWTLHIFWLPSVILIGLAV
jgi:hypothetical protein